MIDEKNKTKNRGNPNLSMGVTKEKAFFGYALYFTAVILGIAYRFIPVNNEYNVEGFETITGLLFYIIAIVAGRGLLWLGVYGIFLTYFRTKWMDFYTYFNIFALLILIVSLLRFLV